MKGAEAELRSTCTSSSAFTPHHVCKGTGLWCGQTPGVTSGGAVSKQEPQPHGAGSRDGAEEPLKPPSVQEAFARCVRAAARREGLAEVGICHLPPSCWWDLHPQQTPPKAVVLPWGRAVLGHARGTLHSHGYSLPRHQLLISSCPVLCYHRVRSGDAKPFLGREAGSWPCPVAGGQTCGAAAPASPSPQNQAAAHPKLQRDHIAAA